MMYHRSRRKLKKKLLSGNFARLSMVHVHEHVFPLCFQDCPQLSQTMPLRQIPSDVGLAGHKSHVSASTGANEKIRAHHDPLPEKAHDVQHTHSTRFCSTDQFSCAQA